MSYFPARAQFRSDNAPEPHAHPQHPSANFRPLSAATPPPPHIVPLPSTTPRSTPLPTFSPRPTATPSRSSPFFHPASPLRQLPSPLRRDATPSAHRPAALHHPSLHTSANFPSPAPPRGLFPPLSARSCSSGRAEEAPRRAGHRLPSPKYAQPTHRPNTHKKERHPLPDAAPWNGCAASTRGRRPYRPLRAGRRTRPAYWPQSTPR